jgi:pimeloyl-ACP methyl ester carboxylesterase
MAAPSSTFEREIKSSSLPIWVESLIGVDWVMLHVSPAYFGFGVPKGDGSPVVLVPGFMGSDVYLYELYLWLRRIGYTPYLSNIGRNADCLNTLANKLTKTISKAHKETGKKVHLIGHSLGGILSRSAAIQNPKPVGSIITLGSPFRGVRSHPWVLDMAEKIRRRIFAQQDEEKQPHCYTGYCDCAAVSALHHALPPSVHQSAIYSKIDGIVDWRVCIHNDDERDFEVTSTHIGLVFNYQVYKLIAARLAEAIEAIKE